ncbi:MAG: type II toxin-antitoxin system Phd/YefM family antitoxin [Solimonas sp.]
MCEVEKNLVCDVGQRRSQPRARGELGDQQRGLLHHRVDEVPRLHDTVNLAGPMGADQMVQSSPRLPGFGPSGQRIAAVRVEVRTLPQGCRHAMERLRRVAGSKLAKYGLHMDISVSKFRSACLALIRRVEAGDGPIDIKRRGAVVARLTAPPGTPGTRRKPWERLRGSGTLLADPGESVVRDEDFEALG